MKRILIFYFYFVSTFLSFFFSQTKVHVSASKKSRKKLFEVIVLKLHVTYLIILCFWNLICTLMHVSTFLSLFFSQTKVHVSALKISRKNYLKLLYRLLISSFFCFWKFNLSSSVHVILYIIFKRGPRGLYSKTYKVTLKEKNIFSLWVFWQLVVTSDIRGDKGRLRTAVCGSNRECILLGTINKGPLIF